MGPARQVYEKLAVAEGSTRNCAKLTVAHSEWINQAHSLNSLAGTERPASLARPWPLLPPSSVIKTELCQ